MGTNLRFKIAGVALLAVGVSVGYSATADAGFNPNNGDGDGGCRNVKGKFTAQNLPPQLCASPVGFCTEGELFGGPFKGSYSFVMTDTFSAGEPDAPSVNFFQGQSTIVLDDGTVLTGVDTGSINLDPPGTLNSGRIATLLTFSGGAAGHLWIRGTANLANGTVSGAFDGLVCADE
jgi:hypothetical protein